MTPAWYVLTENGSGFSRKMITEKMATKMLDEQKQGKHKGCRIVNMDADKGLMALVVSHNYLRTVFLG